MAYWGATSESPADRKARVQDRDGDPTKPSGAVSGGLADICASTGSRAATPIDPVALLGKSHFPVFAPRGIVQPPGNATGIEIPGRVAALGCAVCSKIRPSARQAAGDTYCSDDCAATVKLEELAALTGKLFAVCGRCTKMRSSDHFSKEQANRNGLSGTCKDCARGCYEQNKDSYRLRRYSYQAAPGGIVVECQWPVGSAHGRPADVPAGGQ